VFTKNKTRYGYTYKDTKTHRPLFFVKKSPPGVFIQGGKRE